MPAQTLFRYNWMVKEDWSLIGEMKEEELLRSTTSGVGGIIQTLFHLVDVERSWIRLLQGKKPH
ncbi:DinB family protein [Peribacillus simplex]|uniref:DinB family protein n=1 Tax=Peribacillus simplex TaxID=1478 RepID=UPI003CEA71D5